MPLLSFYTTGLFLYNPTADDNDDKENEGKSKIPIISLFRKQLNEHGSSHCVIFAP